MKPILFVDFDGTLCHDRFWRSIDANNFEKIQNFLFGKNKLVVNEWMRGTHSSEHINRLISKELGIPFKKLWNIFITDCKNMNILPDVLIQIKKQKENFHVILITDNMDCFTRFTVPALKLNSYFDSIINSSDSKRFKDDNKGEIFVQIANRRGSKIEEGILIDNSKSACVIFSKLGGTAHLVTSEKPLLFWLESLENRLTRT